MEHRSRRFTLVDNDDYQLDCEYNDKFFILHLPRLTPTPGVVKSLKLKLDELAEFVDDSSWQMLFTAIEPDNKPVAKLLKIIGAQPQGVAEGLHVYSYGGEK